MSLMPALRVRVQARFVPALALLVALASPASAQQKLLTLDDLFDPQKRVDFTGTVPAGITRIDDTTYLWVKSARPGGGGPPGMGGGGGELLKVNALTGATTPFHDVSKVEAALAGVTGVTADEAKRLARNPRLTLNPARTTALLTIAGDLYACDLAGGRVTRLTSDPGTEDDPAFSPDGRQVAFTRQGNLFVTDVASGRERQLTTDGSDVLLNGKLDWVYQEELFGRGTYRAFWWSPDSTRLAFLQLDQRPVPQITLTDHIPHRQELEVFHYPKAGDPNPLVKLGVVRTAGGPVQWVDTQRYTAAEHLIVNVAWAPDGKKVLYQLQDREQTWLDLNAADAATGAATTLFRETSQAWVDRKDDSPVWLKDGTFLWVSERSGWQHVYHYKPDGTLVRQVTQGEWEVRSLYGVDEKDGWVYFGGTERSHIGADVYRVRLDGSGLTRLSQAEGTHQANFNPSMTHYVGTWSNATTPTQTRLYRADGTEVRVIEANALDTPRQYRLSTPEFLRVPTRDGFQMEAMLIKPPDFDPAKKYPVLQQTYAGPHAPQVRNAWGGAGHMYLQLLAQKGIVVWVCDNRSASGKGAVSAWAAYKRLGQTEIADIEDGLAWLGKQPWVDTTRIGINGWSYGGYMVAYALTHSTKFAMGISGAPVTDWSLYDSIYTERFMRMPQNNPEGYAAGSALAAAKNLSGRLLLIHGTMDDNVHAQNSVRFAYELQKAGKPFELMLYPKSRHGVSDPMLNKHLRTTMLDFTLRTLKPEGAADAAPPSSAAK
jgi:dipeptidyl-peptidase-4